MRLGRSEDKVVLEGEERQGLARRTIYNQGTVGIGFL